MQLFLDLYKTLFYTDLKKKHFFSKAYLKLNFILFNLLLFNNTWRFSKENSEKDNT